MRRETQNSSPHGAKYREFKRLSEKRLGQIRWQDRKRKEYTCTLTAGWVGGSLR